MALVKLVRTLSEQHWYTAEVEMVKHHYNELNAGNCGLWEYIVKRLPNNKVEEITMRDGEIISTKTKSLPHTHRCIGNGKNGRCKNRCFYDFCHIHNPF